ncbi:hypothetical protein Mal64_21480 [Pseudobythopirellula maris]|uniref:JmjC domain-containing protein n=1 Tax=Pseudobythopirellula maris TaxID=2527991 RepID=A0A5C5ZPF4_9BACT|nr:cupin-like domain-containing protein [Pseudobythopirellula maris]TWT88661.1 hypothetical protein Mal64_21480 [Pseudobythopirellula maris]
MTAQLLDNWTSQDFGALERGVLVARHRLAETGLFTDEALARLIDSHPADRLSVNTMGFDPEHFDWREGSRGDVSGEVLVDLVRRGHLWVNIRGLLDNQPEYATLINTLYDELEIGSPGFTARDRSANLLLSSPTAWVPFHLDLPVNMLWHIRGKKRVWVYPPFDTRFASPIVMERIAVGEFSEEAPYDPSFDQYALTYDAEPGQLITWPQLTPHRVSNLEGLNVSLSTEHKNPQAKRRLNVLEANHWLRRNCGLNPAQDWSIASAAGPAARAKELLARGVRFYRSKTGVAKERFAYPKTFVVDPSTEHGFRLLEGMEEKVVAPHEELEAIS